MNESTKAHIVRLLVFYLDAGVPITDPEKVLNTIAVEAGVTRDEVWDVYGEMVKAALYG